MGSRIPVSHPYRNPQLRMYPPAATPIFNKLSLQVFVGGLPYHTSDQSLREFFVTFGEIEEAVVIHDRATGKSKGYGFVS